MPAVPDSPSVSVVLCTHDVRMYDHFRESAESVLNQTYERVELVVVVDGSAAAADRASSEFGHRSDVVLHANESNVGLLASRNTGAELATGDIVAFIDDDAVADECWIAELVETYRDTDAVAAGGRMVPEWVAGKPGFLPEEFYWLIGVTHRGFPEAPGEVRNTFGSNISFRREAFLGLGGFDTEIGGRKGDSNLQGGETELCARLRDRFEQGVMYNPEAVVAHKVFAYRTRFRWLLNRAFWQGYSKRAMESLVAGSAATEVRFFRRLVFESLPARVRGLLTRPSFDGIAQLFALGVLTSAVGAGYAYGSLKW